MWRNLFEKGLPPKTAYFGDKIGSISDCVDGIRVFIEELIGEEESKTGERRARNGVFISGKFDEDLISELREQNSQTNE